jgi:hypothetical protein
MPKSVSVLQKKRGRGRPATGQVPVTAIRLSDELRTKVDAWALRQEDQPPRSEAIRRLIEQALAPTTSLRQRSPESRRKAAELAAEEIDRLGQPSDSSEEHARRKRRLIKGPREFRGVRGNQPKTK